MMSGSRSAGSRLVAWTNLALCVAAPLAPLRAQERAAFDAVLIGRGPTDRPPTRTLHVTPKSLTAPGPSLHQLVAQAFGVEDYQLSGLKGWMDSESYAVYATSEVAMDRDRMMAAVRELLATRFKLKFHRETREMKVLALTVDKAGTKLVPLAEAESLASLQAKQDGDRISLSLGSSVQELIRHLNSRTGAASLGRPVVDRTGLQGLYRIRLTYGVEVNPDGLGGRFLIDYPSALVKELGLRLESTKAPVEVLVIDSAARPELGGQ
jgi:uncharacterized protein (TIGR03435 family)